MNQRNLLFIYAKPSGIISSVGYSYSFCGRPASLNTTLQIASCGISLHHNVTVWRTSFSAFIETLVRDQIEGQE